MRTQGSLFDTTSDVEWPRGAAVELHYAPHVDVEGFYYARQFWWAADLWENFKQAVSAD